jgi:hypothetical protein
MIAEANLEATYANDNFSLDRAAGRGVGVQ